MKVRVDWFLADCFPLEMEVSEEMFEAMVDRALRYFKGGGTIPWERYAMLSEVSMKAFEEAGVRLKIGQAIGK